MTWLKRNVRMEKIQKVVLNVVMGLDVVRVLKEK